MNNPFGSRLLKDVFAGDSSYFFVRVQLLLSLYLERQTHTHTHTFHNQSLLSRNPNRKKLRQRTLPLAKLLKEIAAKKSGRARLRLSHVPAFSPTCKTLLAQIRILAPQVLHLRRRVGHAGDLVGVEAESETPEVDVAAVAGVTGTCGALSLANTANLSWEEGSGDAIYGEQGEKKD